MSFLDGLIAAVAAVVLFLYGLQGFGHELQSADVDSRRAWLLRVTTSRWRGFLIGAFATAVVQSSSAITALVQSSSVTTGLAILLVQEAMLPPRRRSLWWSAPTSA